MSTEQLWTRRAKRSPTFRDAALFQLTITGVLLLGGVMNYLLLFLTPDLLSTPPLWAVLASYVLAAALGERLLMASSAPLISLTGTCMIMSPAGLVIYRLLGGQIDAFIMQLLFPLMGVTLLMGALNTLTAPFKLPTYLISALTTLCTLTLAWWVSQQQDGASSWLYWPLLLVMSARLGWYWERARALKNTPDNAIDVVGALIIDSLNPLYYVRVVRSGALKDLTRLAPCWAPLWLTLTLSSLLPLSGCLKEGEGPQPSVPSVSARITYPEGPYGVGVGDVISDLSFVSPEGESRSLSDLYRDPRKRLLLITTSAEWCTACIKEQPQLQALHERYADRGLGVVVTLFQDSDFEPATPELAAEWRERYELGFDVFADPQTPSTFSPYYDVSLTPMVMLVDVETMTIRYLTQGFDEDAVVAQLEASLTEPLPRLTYPEGPYGVEVGDVISDLSFVSPEGEPRSLSDLYANLNTRLLLITTSAEWCTACIKEQPQLQALYETYAERGLGVVVTLFQDSDFEPATPELAAEWRERYELSFEVLADPQTPSTFSPYYDVSLTPMVMLVDVDTMTIRYLTQGFDEDAVLSQLEATL
jgi:thiol-disulfide isomerase/thioredoxin